MNTNLYIDNVNFSNVGAECKALGSVTTTIFCLQRCA